MFDCLQHFRVGTRGTSGRKCKPGAAHIAGDHAWLTGGSTRTPPKRGLRCKNKRSVLGYKPRLGFLAVYRLPTLLRGGADAAAGLPEAKLFLGCRHIPEGCWLAVLQYAVSVHNTFTLRRVSREARAALTQPSFWCGCRILLPDTCACKVCACPAALAPCGRPSPCSNCA